MTDLCKRLFPGHFLPTESKMDHGVKPKVPSENDGYDDLQGHDLKDAGEMGGRMLGR